MAVKDGLRRRSRRAETREEKAARLAPLEEQIAQHTTDLGAIRVDTGKLQLPKSFVGHESETPSVFRPHRVVVVLLAILLAFIAFIAYLISRMPPS